MKQDRIGVDLVGKVALITGGGRGLGAATCEVLGAAGVYVVAADIQPEPAAEVAARVEAQGGRAIALQLDVSDPAQVESVVGETLATWGRVDFLINNAGIDVSVPVEELTVFDWDRILGVNLRGPFLLSRRLLPLMKQQGYGHIVNITSTAAKRAWENASAYHASKWGLLGFSHALHVEGRPHNVKVTAVVPGGMATPFLLERFPEIDPEGLQDPRNVAETVHFVLSQPAGTVMPEVMVLPAHERSWP